MLICISSLAKLTALAWKELGRGRERRVDVARAEREMEGLQREGWRGRHEGLVMLSTSWRFAICTLDSLSLSLFPELLPLLKSPALSLCTSSSSSNLLSISRPLLFWRPLEVRLSLLMLIYCSVLSSAVGVCAPLPPLLAMLSSGVSCRHSRERSAYILPPLGYVLGRYTIKTPVCSWG